MVTTRSGTRTSTTSSTAVSTNNGDVTNDNYDPKAKMESEHNVTSSAPPPWHAMAFVAFVLSVSLYQCYSSWTSLQEVAVLETFAHRVFPNFMSLEQLAYLRLGIATSIWITFLSTILGDGWIQTTKYPSGSRLQNGVKIPMRGVKTLFPFTSWCWILLGVSFTLNGLLALGISWYGIDAMKETIMGHPRLLQLALMIWQTTAPCAFLVSSVIRYVIWDKVLRSQDVGASTVHLKHPRNIMSHNMNSVFVLTEVALLGNMPVHLDQMYLGAVYGCIYVILAWQLQHNWAPPSQGPHFLYFFLDTTLGQKTTIALAGLVTVLCTFYALLAYATIALDALTPYLVKNMLEGDESEEMEINTNKLLLAHVTFVLLVGSSVSRFRD